MPSVDTSRWHRLRRRRSSTSIWGSLVLTEFASRACLCGSVACLTRHKSQLQPQQVQWTDGRAAPPRRCTALVPIFPASTAESLATTQRCKYASAENPCSASSAAPDYSHISNSPTPSTQDISRMSTCQRKRKGESITRHIRTGLANFRQPETQRVWCEAEVSLATALPHHLVRAVKRTHGSQQQQPGEPLRRQLIYSSGC